MPVFHTWVQFLNFAITQHAPNFLVAFSNLAVRFRLIRALGAFLVCNTSEKNIRYLILRSYWPWFPYENIENSRQTSTGLSCIFVETRGLYFKYAPLSALTLISARAASLRRKICFLNINWSRRIYYWKFHLSDFVFAEFFRGWIAKGRKLFILDANWIRGCAFNKKTFSDVFWAGYWYSNIYWIIQCSTSRNPLTSLSCLISFFSNRGSFSRKSQYSGEENF